MPPTPEVYILWRSEPYESPEAIVASVNKAHLDAEADRLDRQAKAKAKREERKTIIRLANEGKTAQEIARHCERRSGSPSFYVTSVPLVNGLTAETEGWLASMGKG